MTAARILIVDDEEEILRLLARRLRRQGYEVTTATDGPEALARLEDGPIDVAILDYMMPGMNGVELAQECRARHPALRILMLTGSPVIAEIEEARFPCLRKPLENLQALEEAIQHVLAERDQTGGGGDEGTAHPGRG